MTRTQARHRRALALICFYEHCEQPFTRVSHRATPTERRVHHLTELIERIDVAERAGMIPSEDKWRLARLRDFADMRLMRACGELKIERGDW